LSRPAWAKKKCDPFISRTTKAKRAGSVAQIQSPDFKPHPQQKKKKKSQYFSQMFYASKKFNNVLYNLLYKLILIKII
jgi:hypothetical protein